MPLLESEARALLMQRVTIDPHTGCWLWRGLVNKKTGYGRIFIDGKQQQVHRWAYENLVGTIPDGLEPDHLCRVRHCCNPEHLEEVTRSVNNARGLLGFQLTGRCRAGLHDMTNPDNIYIRPDGGRWCRPCDDIRTASWRAANREKINESKRAYRARARQK